jgi:PhnB protein
MKGKSMTAYKPNDYTTVSPYLIVNGASETIAFLTSVFGATELRRFLDSSGKINHAEVRLEDTVLMLADSAEGWQAIPTHVHVYVPNVDETYQRAIEAGAASVQEPVKKEDADKRGGVRDAGGTTWWIATKVA